MVRISVACLFCVSVTSMGVAQEPTETLKRMLADRDAEIRRAACLAVAMKDDKFIVPDVIECITDPNDFVVRAAKASLKRLATLRP